MSSIALLLATKPEDNAPAVRRWLFKMPTEQFDPAYYAVKRAVVLEIPGKRSTIVGSPVAQRACPLCWYDVDQPATH
jgi:hypothetical protein